MTANDLAAAYFFKARKRVRVLEVLLEEESCSDVVREAQELVELALDDARFVLGCIAAFEAD